MLRTYLDGAAFGTVAGTGPPRVLLLHGWRRTREDFVPCAAALANRGIPSLSIDLPGFGASPPPDAPMGARGYAEVLSPLVDELAADAGPLLVVGHSMGGRVAVCLGAAHHDDLAGLVLCAVPLVRSAMPAARPSRRYQVTRALARRHLVPEGVLEASRRRHGSADYRAASGIMRDVLVKTVAESYEDELERLRTPAALLWGADDETVPLAVARAAAFVAPGLRLEVLGGVGHLVPTEAPDRVAAAALRMVERVC